MARWLTYMKERFPPLLYAILATGMSLSGTTLLIPAFLPLLFTLSFVGLLVFFAELRLMDEVKDYDTDVIAHPERPLPRGLLTLAEVRRFISWGMALLLLWAAVSAVLVHVAAGLCFFLVVFWLYLMYEEFFVPVWLSQRPLLYAVSHQFVLLPLAAYPVSLADPAFFSAPQTYGFALITVGAFFTYEVCRKLDPKAHPALNTYLLVYGRATTALLVVIATAVAAYGAQRLDVNVVLWPLEALLIASLVLLWIRPNAYRLIEALAGVSLLVHLWSVAILRLTGLR